MLVNDMVEARINIDKRTNRILNEIKEEYCLKNKSAVIDYVMKKHGNNILQPELRPEFIKEMKKLEKTAKFNTYSSIDELLRAIES